ncbi:MAG: hypothetical protein HGA67_01285 [Candidatus Yonathbacteria bacterium]|nr:hypothetical protein [Candidatus Yonathbacteria bacterium]
MKEVDLSDFPGMLGKLDQKEQVINELVETIEKLAEYIRKGFRMKPGDSETFEFESYNSLSARVDFKTLKNGDYIFMLDYVHAYGAVPRTSEITREEIRNFSLSNPFMWRFVLDLPKLVASVRGRLQSEINEMEEIKTVVKQCPL